MVHRVEPFPVGTPVVWRSRPDGEVGFVFACRVLADDHDVIAVVQATGAQMSRRVGQRGGPRGRSLLTGTWDGARVESVWDGPPAVRVHPIGRSYSVIRSWLEPAQCFRGWYVNLEQPWVRTSIGFDSRDDVLDVLVSDDLGECSLKDEDEMAFAVSIGTMTQDEARDVRATATDVVADIVNRRWPFDDRAWHAFRPRADNEPLLFPTGWDR